MPFPTQYYGVPTGPAATGAAAAPTASRVFNETVHVPTLQEMQSWTPAGPEGVLQYSVNAALGGGAGQLKGYSPGSGMLGGYSPGSGMLGQYSRGSGMLGAYSPGSPYYAGGAGDVTQGAPPLNYDPTYGGIPRVPSLPGTQGAAISSNLANLGGLYNLAGSANQFQQQQLLGQYGAALPGYSNLVNQASGNIASNLAGQVPQDVQNALAIRAAERGISTGIGSPNSNAALLRSLGLTSLDLQNLGQGQLTEAIRRSPVAQPFDISRFFFSPQEAFQAQQGANIYSAAPQPGMAGRAALNAAQAGLGAGRAQGGVAPATGTNIASGIAGRYGQQFGNTATGNVYGGAGGYASNISPTQIYTNWQDWARGIGGSPTGDTDWSRFFASDEDLGGGAPPGTVTTDTASSYDPYGYYFGGGEGG